MRWTTEGCTHVGACTAFLEHLREKEKEHGIEPDPYIDAFMRATAVSGKRQNIVTNYVLRVLGLEVGNQFHHMDVQACQASPMAVHVTRHHHVL